MEKRKKILSIIAAVAAIGAVYFIYEYLMYVETDNAQVEAHSVMLAPKVGGFVTAVHVTEGQKVKAGEVLVELEPRDFENALKQAQAELASAEARLTEAQKNFQRMSELARRQAASRQQFDQASAVFNELKAKREAAAAQLAQAQLNLDNTKIRAPSDGFVARKSADVGQLASVGVPLVGFVDGQERWVNANFKETDLNHLKIGSEVNVSVDAISGKDFRGVVESVSSATGSTFTLLPPDNATGNFTKVVQRVPVRIKLEQLSRDDIEQLRAGLSAVVKVHRR